MKNEDNISENLANEAPFLSQMKKENHFKVPKDYLEALHEAMSNKNLNSNSLPFHFDKSSWHILMPFTAVMIIFTVISNWNNVEEKSILTNNQLSEYLLTEDHFDFDDETVYEAYAEFIETTENTETEDEEYINYLIENNIDINSIIEEL